LKEKVEPKVQGHSTAPHEWPASAQQQSADLIIFYDSCYYCSVSGWEWLVDGMTDVCADGLRYCRRCIFRL